jgi:hypothetical protein
MALPLRGFVTMNFDAALLEASLDLRPDVDGIAVSRKKAL